MPSARLKKFLALRLESEKYKATSIQALHRPEFVDADRRKQTAL